MIRAALFILLVALVSGCGEVLNPICEAPIDAASAYIVGGTPSETRRAVVKVILENNRFCSGTIIGPHTILTAAHCVGALSVEVESYSLGVSFSITHSKFAFPQADLQIVYVDIVLPLPYATIAADVNTCTGVLAQGWGRGSFGELHEREVYAFHMGHGLIWVTEGPCFGDSGSGLYMLGTDELEIIGVLSMGTSDDCLDGTAAYINLLDYQDWIAEKIK